VNQDQHFDSVFKAMALMFQLATTQGWTQIMAQGQDSVGIGYQPIYNNTLLWGFYFMGFIILGSFLMLNLFAGVVIDNFNKERDKLGGFSLLTKAQSDWVDV
jgi:Ion transport protein